MAEYTLYHGDCREILPKLADRSVDSVICDPPYHMIKRSYGMMTEEDWHAMMRVVVAECRRILKPKGSAVFILQPNSERVGRMRPWLWEFMAWTAREWNQVQDFWWWNIAAPPTVHCRRENGLARPGVKACVWLGNPDCYRDQGEVLWSESEGNEAKRKSLRCANDLVRSPSGHSRRRARATGVVVERGGATPFNLIPLPNTDGENGGSAYGHGASTPLDLCLWWLRYLSPPGGVVCDPFVGSGTTGLAALRLGRSFVGIDSNSDYVALARRRLDGPPTPLFDGPDGGRDARTKQPSMF